MNLNTVDISKLPADVRKQFLQLQVMYAEKRIQNKAKDDFLSFVKFPNRCCLLPSGIFILLYLMCNYYHCTVLLSMVFVPLLLS